MAVFVVHPTGFGPNEETAATNAFQRAVGAPLATVRERALAEHAGLVSGLRRAGVRVIEVEAPAVPAPDAVFPNNWVSFHEDGTVVLYPMLAPARRVERRRDVVDEVAREAGFAVRRVVDLSGHEAEGRFLEGTGSLVLDRSRRIAYAALSPRTDRGLAERWAGELGYELVAFDTTSAVYHTNVLLSVCSRCVVVCDAVIAPADRERVLARLGEGREVVRIRPQAMEALGANVLELEGADGRSVFAVSEGAWAAIGRTLPVDEVVAVPFATIEEVGGGGVRCALAEVPRVER